MRNYLILFSFVTFLCVSPAIIASYELPLDTTDTATADTQSVEEPQLPVFTTVSAEPEMPDVKEGLNGSEPPLPGAVTPASAPLTQSAGVSNAAQIAEPVEVTQPASTAYDAAQAKKYYALGKGYYKKRNYTGALDALLKASALYPPGEAPAVLDRMITACRAKAGPKKQ